MQYLQGVAYLCKAFAELVLDKNVTGAWKDALTGLGLLGVHTAIIAHMDQNKP